MAATKAVSPAERASKLLASPQRASAFVLDPAYPRVACALAGSSTITTPIVTRGKRSAQASKDDPEYIVYIERGREVGVPVSAFAHAITSGVITRDECEALLALIPSK